MASRICFACAGSIPDNEPYQTCPECMRNFHRGHTCPLHPTATMVNSVAQTRVIQRTSPPRIFVPQNIPSQNTTAQPTGGWFSVSSPRLVNPMGFWGTFFTSATIAGVVAWIFRAVSSPLPEFFFFTLLFSIMPSAYLLTKNKLGIFLSLWSLGGFANWLSGYWDWTGVIVVSVMAVAGVWGFSGISGYRISFIRTLVATSMAAGAFFGYSLIVDNTPPSDFAMYVTFAGAVFSASLASIIIAKIFGRG